MIRDGLITQNPLNKGDYRPEDHRAHSTLGWGETPDELAARALGNPQTVMPVEAAARKAQLQEGHSLDEVVSRGAEAGRGIVGLATDATATTEGVAGSRRPGDTLVTHSDSKRIDEIDDPDGSKRAKAGKDVQEAFEALRAERAKKVRPSITPPRDASSADAMTPHQGPRQYRGRRREPDELI